MRRSASAVNRFWLACAQLLLVTPFEGAPQENRNTRSITPTIGAEQRQVSIQKARESVMPMASAIKQPAELVPVFERLLQLSLAQAPRPVHIIHFGDSHTTADEWTGALRDLFRSRFGNGGSGFSLAGHPFPGYRRFDAHGGGSPGWHTLGLRMGTGDGYVGLGGLSIATERAGESVFIETACDELQIHYLQQPGGGDLALYDGDQNIGKFSTAGDLGPGFFSYQCSQGAHRFLLKTLSSRPVRLFGWVADKRSGVTYEALGINGTEASIVLRWDEPMLSTYLRSRNPGLIVLAYGTNEAYATKANTQSYRRMFSTLLQRLRHACPVASILVIGPPDSWSRSRGKWQPFPGLDGIIAAQESASLENGCAFWDMRARMGGPGSMRDWVQAGLAQRDYIHFTLPGYRKLAMELFTDLTQQYETFGRIRSELGDSNLHGPTNQNR